MQKLGHIPSFCRTVSSTLFFPNKPQKQLITRLTNLCFPCLRLVSSDQSQPIQNYNNVLGRYLKMVLWSTKERMNALYYQSGVYLPPWSKSKLL
jgi:hypothetical protein